MLEVPLGVSEFSEVIQGKYLFVDTTPLIGEIIREGSKVVLITRPRRFGKTLNMSMLHEFFDIRKHTRALFEGLKITQDERAMQEINQHPTIFISFKDIKNSEWKSAEQNLQKTIIRLYMQYDDVLESPKVHPVLKREAQQLLEGAGTLVDYQYALQTLTQMLEQHYGKRVLVLIDEYDVPIQYGWSHGYYDQVIDFMRVLLTTALKDNPFLHKGVFTGIYRVAKESIFSALNNLAVFPLTKESYSQHFGFTQEETHWAIEQIFSQEGKTTEETAQAKEDVQRWYNGYRFGSHTIYNPWSIISFLRYREVEAYWVNTSDNHLILKLVHQKLQEDKESFRQEMATLMEGKELIKPFDDNTALRDIEGTHNAIWPLFVMSGYLKARFHQQEGTKIKYALSIPNLEVQGFFEKTVTAWLNQASQKGISDMETKLTEGKPEAFAQTLQTLATDTLSYYDIQKDHPEQTYHMLALGILSQLQNQYHIRSNRESGQGRYDILLKPKAGKPDLYGVIIEIKKGLDKLDQAMDQIQQKQYTQELQSEGCKKIIAIAIGVEGKQVETKTAILETAS